MEWPSTRVVKGGAFCPAKVNYSSETKQFLKCNIFFCSSQKLVFGLKVLTDEVKLTTAQRQKWNYFLRNGEPLAPVQKKKNSSNKLPVVTIRPGSSKRRTKEDIIKSGAYVREKFRPLVPIVDREKAKKHLQVFVLQNS